MDDRALFLAVAEAGSFAGAARQLGVSRSTVLRRVEALEARLDVVLLQRAGRQIALTEAGRAFSEGLRPVLRDLERLEEELRQRDAQLTGTLRLWLPVLGTTAVIAGALARFREAHPGVRLDVELSDVADFRVGDFDVALQVGLRRNPSFQARMLYRERLILVASPAYLAARGPVGLETLGKHQAVLMRDARGRVQPWRLPEGAPLQPPPAVVTVNAVGFAHQLAIRGQGIARVPRTLAAPELDAGALVQVLPEVWVEEPVSFVYPSPAGPVARTFLDHAGDWFQRTLGGPGRGRIPAS